MDELAHRLLRRGVSIPSKERVRGQRDYNAREPAKRLEFKKHLYIGTERLDAIL